MSVILVFETHFSRVWTAELDQEWFQDTAIKKMGDANYAKLGKIIFRLDTIQIWPI